MERSLRVLRELRGRGRHEFVSDEAVQDRAARNAQLLAQGCADIALHIRNILVHGYLDVDHGRLFDELGWIEDAAQFAVVIERWLEKNVDPGSSV